jgi:hypothetical protein
MESTAQRTSRIKSDDAAAHSAYAHAQDFYDGLATYSIEPSGTNFLVYERTPNGQLSGFARTLELAHAKIEAWKNDDLKNGYRK